MPRTATPTLALDAEASGDERLSGFFREAGVAQARLAERAKGLLGIIEVSPEPGVRPEGAVSSGTAAVGEATGVSATGLPNGGAETPLSGASPVPSDEEVVAEEASQAATSRIVPEDFEPTISALQGGVIQLEIGQAAAEVETWERRLEATDDPELQSIAGNLGALRTLLSTDDTDVAAARPLLTTLGEQVRQVISSDAGALVAEQLQQLSELLTREGRSLSG